MANNFFNDSNKAYSENLNDGILVGNAFDWTISIGLPSDTDGVFPSSSDVVMAKVADVSATPNSNLSIGSTIENNSSSSQVYRLTVYPNFNRFGGFKSISLTADSGVTFYIANKGGNSPIASNLDYDDLGNVPELKVLKEYDIVLTIPKNKEVTGLEFVFQSSSADVSGSISQGNVSGLTDRLDSLENTDDGVFFYQLYASDYNPTIDTDITVSCKCTDITGSAVSGKSLTLYKNGTSVSSSITNNDGVASWTITMNDWDKHHFNVMNQSLQLQAKGFKLTTTKTNNVITYKHYVDESIRTCIITISSNSNFSIANGEQYTFNSLIPSRYAPKNNIYCDVNRNRNISFYCWSDGTGGLYNSNTTTQTAQSVGGQITYSY